MPLSKTCKQCSQQFTVEDEDLEFYKKVSPTLGGKTYEWPAPTLCMFCRGMRRQAWRNERNLYKTKCAKSGKEIVSVYSPDKTDYKVYELSEWWKDDWDAMQYGKEFDSSRGFFDQFDELLKAVPRLSLFNTQTQNCDYVNYTAECKDCYMSSVIYYQCDKVHYSYLTYYSKNSIDIGYCDKVENCYELVSSNGCYGCRYSNRLTNCRDCYFCQDLNGCSDCILSNNLTRKQYCVRNKQLTKEEYEKEKKELDLGSYQKVNEYLKEYEQMRKGAIVKFANLLNCENCEGDNLINCKNVKKCFSAVRVENSRYSFDQEDGKNIYDCEGGSYEWAVESNHTGFGSNFIVCSGVLNSSFLYYCENCHNCRDCFGCVGLRGKQFCVFNKQYSKEEYEQLVEKIIKKMVEGGEWGEFFPFRLSPFGYNESLANDYHPKTKEEVKGIGAKWQDNDYSLKYDGPFYEPKDNIKDYIENEGERNKLLAGILKCEVSGKPFKLVPQELAFYFEQGVPIPRRHYDVRYKERFKMRNPKVLHHRQCVCEEQGHEHEGRCENEFETTYAPDRPEKIYCERCYQKSVV
ncbi:MAG: hypothetical protein OEV37_01960 [Candidatus Berkelbacteria bacterium]|nr:hypothetical protein [Candidatus Berkelbacteria bacterium]